MVSKESEAYPDSRKEENLLSSRTGADRGPISAWRKCSSEDKLKQTAKRERIYSRLRETRFEPSAAKVTESVKV